jgi:hypothetical protein
MANKPPSILLNNWRFKMAEDINQDGITIDEAATTESTAVASPTNWQDRLAKFAVAAVAAEAAPSGSFISAKSGVLQFAGVAVAGNALDVVVIDSIYENAFYTGDYDSDNPTSPVCFAFAHDDSELAPHTESTDPQHATCKGCPQNEFGTAERGKGKACKNSRRIAVVPGNDLKSEVLETAEVAFVKLPVTSVKNWGNYVNTLATIDHRPPFAVVTTIGVVPDLKTQFKITFTKKALINDEGALDILIKRMEAQQQTKTAPYQANSTVAKSEKPTAKGKGKF